MSVSYSKINSVNNGILVCVDDKKDVYKYIPLEEVIYKGRPLKETFAQIEIDKKRLEERITKIEKILGINVNLTLALAEDEGDDS